MPKNAFEVVLKDINNIRSMGYDKAEEVAVQFFNESELNALKKLEDGFDGTVHQAKKLIADHAVWSEKFRAIYKDSVSPEIIEKDIDTRNNDLKQQLQALADKQNDYVQKQQDMKKDILKEVKEELTMENAKKHLTSAQLDYVKTLFDLGADESEMMNVLAEFNFNPMLIDLMNLYGRSNKDAQRPGTTHVPVRHPVDTALSAIGGRLPLPAGQIKLDNSWLPYKF